MTARSKTARKRRLVFAGGAALLVYLCLELLSCATYAVLEGEWMSPSALQAERARRIEASAGKQLLLKQGRERKHSYALHPFTGYVNGPGSTVKHYPDAMNRYGYAGDDDMFSIEEDDHVVALTGGSLAMRLFLDQRDSLAARLAELEGLPPERVKLVCLGMSGFKQPQSLMAVVYFLSLGGRLDVLINLDGFNEVTRLKPGLHPSYPTTWPRMVASIAQTEELELVGRIVWLRDRRAASARLFSRLRWSASANLLWLARDRSASGR